MEEGRGNLPRRHFLFSQDLDLRKKKKNQNRDNFSWVLRNIKRLMENKNRIFSNDSLYIMQEIYMDGYQYRVG